MTSRTDLPQLLALLFAGLSLAAAGCGSDEPAGLFHENPDAGGLGGSGGSSGSGGSAGSAPSDGGSDTSGGTGGYAGSSGGPGCDEPLSLCEDRCVDVLTDPLHCGTCNNSCELGDVCENAQCKSIEDCTTTPCSGLTYCDLSTKKCLPGCLTSGQCAAQEQCDPASHQCECVPAYHRCGGACVPESSPQACGSTCAVCPTDANGAATCVAGQCGLSCNQGYHLCAGQCASNSSTATCGASCSPCPSVANGEATCQSATCGIDCHPGFNACNGSCVVDSVQSCGTSCVACPTQPGTQPICTAGICYKQCINGAQFGPSQLLLAAPMAAIAAGDVTGDGLADVVYLNSQMNTLVIRAGNGAGGFQAPTNYNVSVESLALGDVNGDGKLDVVVGHYQGVSVLLAATSTLKESSVSETDFIDLGDVDADGKLDLITGGGGLGRVYLGDGTGGFTFKHNVMLSQSPRQVTAADFNGDGRSDVVFSSHEGLHVALAQPGGTMGTVSTIPLATQDYGTRGVAVGDLNGDGKKDVVTMSPTQLLVLIGNGNGTFQAPSAYAENFEYGGRLVLADFNGDGRPDVAYPGNADTVKSIWLRLTDPNGALGPASSRVLATQTPVHPLIADLAAADFNQDGLEDLAVLFGGAHVLLAACK